MNYYDLFLTTSTRARVSYTNEGFIRSKMHQTEMNDFMLQSDTHASRSMDMDGWVGFMGGKDWDILGGHNDEVGSFFLVLSSNCRPALVWCFFILLFVSHGERMRLYLCQSQRLVKKFMRFLSVSYQPSPFWVGQEPVFEEFHIALCVFCYFCSACLIPHPHR